MRESGLPKVRLVGPPWVKVIWAPSFVVSLYLGGKQGTLGGIGIHESLCPPPPGMFGDPQNWQAVWEPVTPTILALWPMSGATDVVTTECSEPVFTMKVNGWPPTFILTIGSQGPNKRKPGSLEPNLTQSQLD